MCTKASLGVPIVSAKSDSAHQTALGHFDVVITALASPPVTVSLEGFCQLVIDALFANHNVQSVS